jgi:hypothetical protein
MINPLENDYQLFIESSLENLSTLSVQHPRSTWHENVRDDDNLSFFIVTISSPRATQNVSITNYIEFHGNSCNISDEKVWRILQISMNFSIFSHI